MSWDVTIDWRVGRRRLGDSWRCEGHGRRDRGGRGTTAAEPAHAPDGSRLRVVVETVAPRGAAVIPLGVVLVREDTRAQGNVSSCGYTCLEVGCGSREYFVFLGDVDPSGTYILWPGIARLCREIDVDAGNLSGLDEVHGQ